MLTHPEYMILKSALCPTLGAASDGYYYVDPNRWLTWESVIELLQNSGYLDYELTDGFGYRVCIVTVREALLDYKSAQTYTPSNVFETYIESELEV